MGGTLTSTGQGLRVGNTPTTEVSIARRLIEKELVGWCLRCRLRVGDTPTSRRISVRDSDGEHSHQRGGTEMVRRKGTLLFHDIK